MPTLIQRINLLARSEAGARVAVVSEALSHARSSEMPALARAACTTDAPQAVASVIRQLHRLETEPGPLLYRVTTKTLRAAIDLVRADEDPRTARNVLEVVVARPEPGLIGLLPRLLGDEREGVAKGAGTALRAITQSLHGVSGRHRPPVARADGLDDALAAAGRSYRVHRSEAVLLAIALISERPRAMVRALLEDDEEPVTRAVAGIADRVADPLVHRNLVRWLGNARLARAAGRALAGLTGEQVWADTLRDGHLLRAARRRGPLLQLDRAGRSAPPVSVAVALPSALQSAVPVLLERLDLPARVRLNRLADLIALPSPVARQRAVTALLAVCGAGAMESLIPFALDRDLRVARLAAQGLLAARRSPDAGLLDRLSDAAHPPVALRAAAVRARMDAQGLLRNWHILPPAHRRAAAAALRAADRAGLVAGLHVILADGTGDRRLEAIDLARRMRLVADLEADLIRLATGESPREASAAVAALGTGRTALRVSVLADALRDPHPRVVANAVEGLARAGSPRALDAIAPLMTATENRPRANAVRAVLIADRPRGLEALRAMLTDANPLHRVSAVWVARRVSASETLDVLADLASADPVPEIRVRAEGARRWVAESVRARTRSSRVRARPLIPVVPRVLKRGVIAI